MLELESEGQAKTHNKDKATFILFLQNLVTKLGCGKQTALSPNVQVNVQIKTERDIRKELRPPD